MPNIILTGFSGTGKTATGREVARLLGWPFVDTDSEIVGRTGKGIEEIFAEDGEAVFRHLEEKVLDEVCARRGAVIAAGGGANIDPANRELLLRSGVVVCLEATPDTIQARLFPSHPTAGDGAAVRPLLGGPSPRQRIEQVKEARQPAYVLAHWTVHTDGLTLKEAAQEVIRAWDVMASRLFPKATSQSNQGNDDTLAAVVHYSTGTCPIHVGWGLLERLGQRCRDAGLATTAYIITDETVSHLHGRRAQQSLEDAGISAHTLSVPAGEPSKALEVAGDCYRWLAERRAERGHFVVALGGGVVGDLAGFVAATFNRGIPFVQVPTSLAAMVDASIGGKTAVNLPQGKNLVGLFYQPRFILADVQALTTLPRRELASGWAEAIKHGLILDADLLDIFEGHAEAIVTLKQPLATEVIRRSMAIKADVVSRDERETLGIRTLLNYGHTTGHALEAATEYGKLLHGEAVSVGMAAAARISQAMGLIGEDVVVRQDRLLKRFGLPTRYPGVERNAMRQAMLVDKKTMAGAITWVLLQNVGQAVLRSDVPPEMVEAALDEVT